MGARTWPLFINWHTPEYAEEARRLRASLERLNLPHWIDCSPSRGSWQRNTCYKPQFILECWGALLPKYPGVMWLDADAELVALPVLVGLLAEGPTDLAYCERPLFASGGQPEGQMGSLYVGKTALGRLACRAFLSAWVRRSSEVYMHSDQTHFNNMIGEGLGGRLVRSILPRTYCVMPEDPLEGAVILQHQASRRLVSVVGSEPPPPLLCRCKCPVVTENGKTHCARCGRALFAQGVDQ